MKNLFGYYLNSCRREKGLSLRECAALCKISHTHIDSLEKGKDFRTGKKVSPTPETIEKIAAGLMLREQMLFNLSLEKVNSKFNCFLYYTESETIKSTAREILSNNDLRSLRSLDELVELQENIFLSLFSRSVEAANFNIEHVDFPTYISMLLPQKQFKNSIEPAIYKKLVEKYGVSSGIAEDSTYYKTDSHLNAATEPLNSNLKHFAQSPSPVEMEAYGLRPIEMKRFPMLGKIACGEPIYCNQDYETFIEASANIKADFCLEAKGDSMINARIFNGDIVFIRAQSDVENGEIAAVVIDDTATLKRVYKYQNSIELRAENPMHKPINLEGSAMENVRILGKAVAFQSTII